MAGGVSAGRLSIELVAEVARLQQDLDKAKRAVSAASSDIGRNAKAANDNLAGMGRGAQKMAADVARLKAQLDPAWSAQQRYNQQVELGTRAFKGGAIDREQFIAHMRRINAELKGTPGQFDAVTTSAGAQRAGMQQLGFQLQDFAVQTAGGTSAVRAFGQQFPQALGAMQLMYGQTSKLGAFLGGPWGIALGVAAAALVPLISRLFETEAAANSARTALEALRAERLREAQQARLLSDARSEYNKLLQDEAKLEREIAVLSRGRTQADGTPMFAYAQYQELLQVRKDLAEASKDIDYQFAKENTSLRELVKTTERHTAATSASVSATQKVSDAERERERLLKQQARELEAATQAAENYAEGLEQQVRQFGLTAIEIKRIEVAARAAEAPTAELAQRIRDAGAALEAAQIDEARRSFDQMIVSIYDEIELLPLVGAEREKAALLLEKEGKLAEWAAQGLTDLNERWLTYAAARLAEIDAKSALERDLEAARALEQQLGALLQMMERLSGVGGIFGDLAAVLTSGNPIATLMGMGGLGTVAGSLLGGGAVGEQLTRDISRTLKEVFGVDGQFANTLAAGLSDVFQGVAVGSAVGGLVFGNKSARTGSTLGGAAGSVIGGPIGSIVGSLLGGFVGDLIRGNEKGRATFNGAGGFSISGDNASREAAAGDLARAVIEAADRVADALGATGVSLSGTIGVRNSSVRYNPTGTSLKDGLNFGQDAEAAIKAAIANASFEGQSDTFDRLLKSGGDIEAQIDKVLALRAALDAAAQEADPTGAAIEALNRDFDLLRSYLDEGNASAEERAQIEALYAQKLAEITQETADSSEILTRQRELEAALLAAQGDVLGAVLLQRQAELAALDASLRPLQEQVYAAQDLQVQRALEIQLMQALGDEAGAVAAQREIERRALTESQLAIQERIWAVQDAQAAEQAAAEAARQIAQEREGLETRLLQALGDTTALRERELAALAPANRAIQEQIYAVQDLADANAEAARVAEQAAATANAIAQERAGLETRLWQIQGDTAALRARELASVDQSNRALLEQIYLWEAVIETENRVTEQRRKAASEVESLEARLLQLQGDTAALRQRELEALEPANRALLETIFALEDAQAAAARAAEAERALAAERDSAASERASLERRILELEGDTAALLALERAAISESNRVLFDRIQQLEMEADRAEQLRLQTERLAASRAAIEDERYALETRLLQAVGATANLRDRELKLLEPANRKYLEFIYALEDQAAATAEAERAAAELAATEERIANERASLEARLLAAQGDSAALRALELAALDPANRAILDMIFALEDQAEAARAAAEAEAALAAEQQAIAQERFGLESRLLSLLGDTTALRARELEAVNAVNRGILEQIYAIEDQQAAAEAAAAAAAEAERARAEADRAAQDALRAYESRVAEARTTLASAYEREASGLQSTIDKFESFSASLREFRDGLFAGNAGGASGYERLQTAFLATAAAARGGDERALGDLQATGQAFLSASLAQASSRAEYARDVSRVARAVDTAIMATRLAGDAAADQLAALQQLVGGYIEINESVLSVAEAIEALEDTIATGPLGGAGSDPVAVTLVDPSGNSSAAQDARVTAIEDKLDRLLRAAERTAQASEDTVNIYLRPGFDLDQLAFKTTEQTA